MNKSKSFLINHQRFIKQDFHFYRVYFEARRSFHSNKINSSSSSKKWQNINFGKVNEIRQGIKSPGFVEKDELTWRDALRNVFGLKLKDRLRIIEEKKQKNDSKQDDVDSINSEADKDAEQAASATEIRIAEIQKEIAEMEKERENVAITSDNPDIERYKAINKLVKSKRSEVEKLTTRLNSNAMVFTPEEKTRWSKLTEELKDAPLIRDLLLLKQKVNDSKVVKAARDAAEDARNVFETSQNPIVYRAYGAYEGVFRDSPFAEALKEFRNIDSNFSIAKLHEEMEEEFIPKILDGYLKGNLEIIEHICESEALSHIKASINTRKENKQKMDDTILNIDHITVLDLKSVDKVGPVAFIQFMAQHIDCMYDYEGNVVQGKDDKIQAVFYVLALKRKYFEDEMKYGFVCKEFVVAGIQAYL